MPLQDLAETYARKTDEELLLLADAADQLTPEALLFLNGEIAKRRISRPPVPPSETLAQAAQSNEQSAMPLEPADSVRPFLGRVMRVYHSRFLLFIAFSIPAVVGGYWAVQAARQATSALYHRLPRVPASLPNIGFYVEASFINVAGYLASWLFFCLAYAAICAAVDRMTRGEQASFKQCAQVVGQWFPGILRFALLFFFFIGLLSGAGGLLTFGAFGLLHRMGYTAGRLMVRLVSFVIPSLTLLPLSRLALALPAMTLGDYGLKDALFRSDELTEGTWVILAALLSKSLIGGYIVAMLPWWVRIWMWEYVHVPHWLANVASFAGVTVMEPTMFIGFALLYAQRSRRPHSTLGEYPLATEASSA